MADVIALFEAATRLTGRDDIGLEFARRVRPGTFNVLGYALMTCRTLGEAIEVAPHYRRLVFDIGYSEMRFVQTERQARLSWHVVSNALPYCRSLAESLIASWYHFGRWMAGVDLPLEEVLFLHPAPGDPHPYEDFFDCPVRFGAAENALMFSQALLAMPLVQADENLHPRGLGLKVYDCYRPRRAVAHFARWAADLSDQSTKAEFYPNVDKSRLFELGYIAQRSGHSRGSTVDVTLVDLTSGAEIDMGTPFDLFDTRSWPADETVSAAARANRMMLQGAMREHGFRSLPEEWWHFTLENEPHPETYFDFVVR